MCKNKEKTSLRIRRYFTNLFRALFGRNPFRIELDESREQLKEATENMKSLQDQLNFALKKWNQEAKMLEQSLQQVKSLQVLTENLRERIVKKDRLIAELEKELNEK